MQGKKVFTPKLFTDFRLDEFIPEHNIYKILDSKLDLNFIYQRTDYLYSHTGKPSLDPVVFFKCMLIGYLENICSDRALERNISMRMDLRFFIGYDVDQKTPDHSTFCKTRKRIPIEIFQEVFDHILKLCVDEGLVAGHTQAIDSAYINANASIDRMTEVKMIDRDPQDYIEEVRQQDDSSKAYGKSDEQIAQERIKKSQQTLERYAKMRKEKYTSLDGGKDQRKNKRRFFSNATHMSSTDPDAKVAKKSGKPRMICYSAMMAVDTENHVITHMSAELAHKKDSRYLIETTLKTKERIEKLGLKMTTLLADTGFSSGENYQVLDNENIDAFIPVHGGFKAIRDGFTYDESTDAYTCSQGQKLPYTQNSSSGGYMKKRYTSSKKICRNCPVKEGCINSRGFKQIEHTIHRKYYDQMIAKLKSEKGRAIYQLRMHTVEPVFGSLQQHYGLRWINTRGKDLASKVMLMAAAALNLKKWVKSIKENSLNAHLKLIYLFSELTDAHTKKINFIYSRTH